MTDMQNVNDLVGLIDFKDRTVDMRLQRLAARDSAASIAS
jgi:hypothetical protein